ncbi:hypothetical protein vseg_016049 [Gypsophila vaccaria]
MEPKLSNLFACLGYLISTLESRRPSAEAQFGVLKSSLESKNEDIKRTKRDLQRMQKVADNVVIKIDELEKEVSKLTKEVDDLNEAPRRQETDANALTT